MRRFITDASHELRTPLTTIRGFAELYRQGAASDVEMLMCRIESESRRMGLLVEDLLLLARLDRSGRWSGTASTCWRWPATPCTTRSRSRRPNARSPWRCSTDPAPRRCSATRPGCARCWATWSPTRCSTPPTPRGVTVRVGTDDDNAVLEVRDEGPGMSAGGRAPSVRAVLPRRLVTRPGPAAAPGWACRSSTRWSTRTAARSASPPRPGRAAGSRSTCRASRTSPAHVS